MTGKFIVFLLFKGDFFGEERSSTEIMRPFLFFYSVTFWLSFSFVSCSIISVAGGLHVTPVPFFHSPNNQSDMNYPIFSQSENTHLQTLESYDADSAACISFLQTHPSSTGRIGATGMCLGGHLAYRCALSPSILATTCFFATDIHSKTLGKGKNDDSLERAGEIKGEVVMIFGKKDGHVSAEGRDLIRKRMGEKGVRFSWVELEGAQRKFA